MKWTSKLNEAKNANPDCNLFGTKGNKVFGYLRINNVVDINSDLFVSCFFKDVHNDSEIEIMIPEDLVHNLPRLLKREEIIIASYSHNLRFLTDNDGKTHIILSCFSLVNVKKEIAVDDKTDWLSLN